MLSKLESCWIVHVWNVDSAEGSRSDLWLFRLLGLGGSVWKFTGGLDYSVDMHNATDCGIKFASVIIKII